MRVLLMLNGQPPSSSLIHRCAENSDQVVGADNGARHLLEADVEPDLIVGDIDSLPAELHQQYSGHLQQVPTQENTDFEKSLTVIHERWPDACVTVLGATGRRYDHELGNLLCAASWAKHLKIRCVSDNEAIYFPQALEPLRLELSVGQTLSLFGLPSADSVRTSGLKYPLVDEFLPMGTRGVSNEAAQQHVTVEYRSGCLVVVVIHDGFEGDVSKW